MCVGDFDFADGSTHVIGAPSPQLDTSGHWWVFDSFSNGASANSIYTATGVSAPDTADRDLRSGSNSNIHYESVGIAAQCGRTGKLAVLQFRLGAWIDAPGFRASLLVLFQRPPVYIPELVERRQRCTDRNGGSKRCGQRHPGSCEL